MSAALFARVETTAATVEAASRALAAAQVARDEAVREALAAGASVNDIMAPAGLSRWRIYQIRDRRR